MQAAAIDRFGGGRQGYCVEFEMWDRKGKIDGKWWTYPANIIQQRSE